VDDPASGWSVTLTADRSDVLGCLVWELKLFRATVSDSDTVALRAWADRLADRVTGLLEPLKVIEIDRERGEGFLRSESPRNRDGKLYYYEVFLKGTREAALRRYQALQNTIGKREQIAFAMTHEALAKIVSDSIASE